MWQARLGVSNKVYCLQEKIPSLSEEISVVDDLKRLHTMPFFLLYVVFFWILHQLYFENSFGETLDRWFHLLKATCLSSKLSLSYIYGL